MCLERSEQDQFAGINGHHAFAVRYKADGNAIDNKELSLHYDASHVTLNVCLGRVFVGSKLFFCGLLENPESHSENVSFDHLPGSKKFVLGKVCF